MPNLEWFYLAIAASPNDWLLRAALADWFEENGNQCVADCLRWMVDHRKRPFRSPGGHFHWFDARRTQSRVDPESDVPEEIYCHLTGIAEAYSIYRTYVRLREAEEDFQAAWIKARLVGRLRSG